MKKTVIGGILAICGTFGTMSVFNTAADNLVSGWSTPPGRFITTVIEYNLIIPLILFSVMLILGLVILGIEYFRKEK